MNDKRSLVCFGAKSINGVKTNNRISKSIL